MEHEGRVVLVTGHRQAALHLDSGPQGVGNWEGATRYEGRGCLQAPMQVEERRGVHVARAVGTVHGDAGPPVAGCGNRGIAQFGVPASVQRADGGAAVGRLDQQVEVVHAAFLDAIEPAQHRDPLEEAVPDAGAGKLAGDLARFLPQPGPAIEPGAGRRLGVLPDIALDEPANAEPAGELDHGVLPGESQAPRGLAQQGVESAGDVDGCSFLRGCSNARGNRRCHPSSATGGSARRAEDRPRPARAILASPGRPGSRGGPGRA